MVSMSIGAIAATNLEEISAYLNKGIKIKLDGKDWTPRDTDGTILYPITYDGTTYLPVRAAGEAVGKKVGWDPDTQTVLLGEAQPTPAPVGTSRSNPAPVGTKVSYDKKDIIDDYSGTISVDEVIRGDEAWKQIQASNMFNSAPKAGYEYILAKITVSVAANKKADAKVHFSSFSLTLVSSEGKDYEGASVVEPDPAFDADLYVGASHTGWAAYQVKVDDKNSLLAFGRQYDGTGGVWIKTNRN